MNKVLIIGLAISITIALVCYSMYVGVVDKLDITTSNMKAYSEENNSLKDRTIVYQFSIDQLKYYNDSALQKLDSVRKELNIKDKNLKQIQYLLSQSQRADTVVFRDTLFNDPTLNIDTMLGDKWYSLKLGLTYPSTIAVTPTFTNEIYTIVSSKKETIDPPKKLFFLRWFQRKHTILEVVVINENPYSTIKQQKFIEIVK